MNSTSDLDNNRTYIPAAAGDLPYEAYSATLFVLNYVFKPLVVLAGAPANVLCCWVFLRQGLGDRMNLCLFSRSLADLCYIASSLPLTVAVFVEQAVKARGLEVYFQMLTPNVGVMLTFKTVSGNISLLIAVERCLCVVLPLRAANLIETRTVALLLATVFASTLLGFSGNFFKLYPTLIVSNATGEARWTLAPTAAWVNLKALFRVVEDVFLMIVTPLAAMLGVSVATLVTVVKLKVAMSWRHQTSTASTASSKHQVHQAALTSMLVLVSGVYIACMTPLALVTVARLCVSELAATGRYSNLYLTATSLAFYVTYLNSSFNVFIYYFRSSRFRREMKALCGMRARQTFPRQTTRHGKFSVRTSLHYLHHARAHAARSTHISISGSVNRPSEHRL